MSLADQMITDVSTVFLQTDEHAATRNCKNDRGKKTSIAMIIEQHTTNLVQYDGGTKRVRTATIGVAESSGVNENWTFDVDDDGDYWVFDREIGGIQNDQCGWLWVPVTIATQEEAASLEYRRR